MQPAQIQGIHQIVSASSHALSYRVKSRGNYSHVSPAILHLEKLAAGFPSSIGDAHLERPYQADTAV